MERRDPGSPQDGQKTIILRNICNQVAPAIAGALVDIVNKNIQIGQRIFDFYIILC